jgi:cytidine deaminase
MLNKVSFTYLSHPSLDLLIKEDQDLIHESQMALKKAYSVYSGFSVGASALLENGEIMSANNQENSAFPSSLCAERVLLYYCRANFPNLMIKKIAISVSSLHGQVQHPISPCGACRQVMVEYEKNQKKKIPLFLNSESGVVYEMESIEDLLPLSFNSNVLKQY